MNKKTKDTVLNQALLNTIKKSFNKSRPQLQDSLEPPTLKDLEGIQCFKYADCDFVYAQCENDYVKYVLSRIPIFNKHKRVLVDIKVQDLVEGDYPCLPGWHLDGSSNKRNLEKKPETFTLFVTGSHACTEFVDEPIELDIDASWDFSEISKNCSKQIPESVNTWALPSCRFGTYDDSFFHRGPKSRGNERRLLIRTTETDILRPKNSIYQPSKYS